MLRSQDSLLTVVLASPQLVWSGSVAVAKDVDLPGMSMTNRSPSASRRHRKNRYFY